MGYAVKDEPLAPPADGLDLEASDVTGQHRVKVHDVAPDTTVGELVRGLVRKMGLASTDPNGNRYVYHVRHDAGRHLHASEIVGDVLHPGDHVSLLPNVDAGSGRASS